MSRPIIGAPWETKQPTAPRAEGIDPELKTILRRRADHMCELCGAGLYARLNTFNPLDVHHRKLRSRGGTDGLDNLVVVCRNCHRNIHKRPAWATEHGWMVASGDDPATVAVAYRLTAWRLLDDKGNLIDAETGAVA